MTTNNIKTVLNHPAKGQDIRRFQLGSLEKPFDQLIGFLTEIYALPPEKLALRYRDDDGDDCSIGSNIELLEAFRIAKQDGRSVLKVDVSIDEEPARKEESMTPGKSCEPALERSNSESSNDEDFIKVEIESESKSVSPILIETSNDTKVENHPEVSNPIKILDLETSPASTEDTKEIPTEVSTEDTKEIPTEVSTPIKIEDSLESQTKIESSEIPPKVSEISSVETQTPDELEIKVLPSVSADTSIESPKEPAPTPLASEPVPIPEEVKSEFPEPVVESKTEFPEGKELPPFPSRTEFFSLLADFLHDSKVMDLVQLLLPQVLKLLETERPPTAEVLKNVDTVIKTLFDFAPVLKAVPLFERLLPFTNQLAADPKIQPLVKDALRKLHDASKLTSFFRSGPNGSIPYMPDFVRLYNHMNKVVSGREVTEEKEIPQAEPAVVLSVHHGVTCDECQMSPIQGNRYKCYACPNYDLCEMCEESGKHPIDHPMLKMRSPISHKQCRGRKPGQPRAHFVEDVTLRDGSACYPGITVEKTWALKNNGEFRWPQGVKLLFLSGDLAPESVKAVPQAEPGATVQVSALIKVPLTPKQYTGYYRLATDDGKKFGPRFWVDLVVIPNKVEQPEIKKEEPVSIDLEPISIQVEVSKQEPINSEVSKQEPKVYDPSVYNYYKPVVDAKKPEEPKVDIKKEEPKVDIKKEEPKVDIKKEEPKVDLKKEEPKVKPEEPKKVDVKKEQPKVDIKKPEQPKVKNSDTAKKQKSPYTTQLDILESMGFQDAELNSYLLANNEGNVQRVVEWMLSHGTH